MLHTANSPTAQTASSGAMRGRDLAKRARRSSAAIRAVLASKLMSSEIAISGLTRQQAAQLLHVHLDSVSLAGKASEAERDALRRGKLSLRQLRARRAQRPTVDDVVSRVRAALDTSLPMAAE